MLKKVTNFFVIVMFLAIVSVPLACTNTNPDAISATDNRALAASPLKAMAEGVGFSDAVSNYINDRIGFRNAAIELNNRISYFGFHTSPTPKVILGNDGWLFYDSIKAGGDDTLAQYAGRCQFSDEELELIASNMIATQNYLKQRNCDFVLFIAPNKERVYSEYLPRYLQNARVSDTCNTEQVVNYLRANTDIPVVWADEAIEIYKKEHPDDTLYLRTDTHWNTLGAYLGADALLSELGITIAPADNVPRTIVTPATHDLLTMMAIGDRLQTQSIDYRFDGYPKADTVFEDGGFSNYWKYTNTGKDARRVLLVRDSFTTAMRDFIGAEFDYINMVHRDSFDQSMVDTEAPDIFVYSFVERFDSLLLDFAMQ